MSKKIILCDEFKNAFGSVLDSATEFKTYLDNIINSMNEYHDEVAHYRDFKKSLKVSHMRHNESRLRNKIKYISGNYYDINDYINILYDILIYIEKSGVYELNDCSEDFINFVNTKKGILNNLGNVNKYDIKQIRRDIKNRNYDKQLLFDWLNYFEELKEILEIFGDVYLIMSVHLGYY